MGHIEASKSKRQPEQIFTFFYKHPATDNDCPNQGKNQRRTFSAVNKDRARIFAENEQVICVNPSCGVNYELLRDY